MHNKGDFFVNIAHWFKECLNHIAKICMLNVILNKSQSKF